MYIPTSKDVKFKAKGWIDIFGGRTAKGAGSGINALFTEMSTLMVWGSVISLGIIAIWIPIAFYVGRTNNKLVEEHKIIELTAFYSSSIKKILRPAEICWPLTSQGNFYVPKKRREIFMGRSQ